MTNDLSCLGRNESARKLTRELERELEGVSVVDKSEVYAGHKDFNEFLQAMRPTKTGGILV